MNSVDNKNNLEAQLSAYGIVRQADSYSFPLEAEWVKLDSPAYPKIGEILATFSKNKLLKEAMQVYKALTKIDPSRVSVMTKNSWILAISSPYSKPAVAHPSAENTSASSSAVPTAETASSAAAPNTTQSVSSAPASTVQDISASSSAFPTAQTASSAAASNTTQSVSSAPASTVQDISASSSAAPTAQTASSAAAPNTTESGSTAAVSDEKESDSGAAATTSDASSSADSVSEVSDSASELSPLEAQFAIPARRIHKESELYRKLISHMPRGIPNSGSDCFIGSLFQVIVVGDSRFQEELINIPAVQEVLGNYSSNKGLSMRPLREVLQYIQMQREDKGDRSWLVDQHDPHDALMLFMSCLSKDSPLLQHLRIRREYVKLDGYLKPQISTKYEENWGVLTIPFMHNKENRICSTRNDGRVYFEDLLAHYLKRNGVAGEEARFDLLSENGMDALRGVNVPLATESTQFEFPPSSLVVSLSRFAYNGKLLLNTEKGQINIPVQTPEKFALNSDCFEGGYSAEYELSGFITHEGLRVNSGHYFGCVSRVDSEGKKRYFSFNDSRVAEINRDHFLFLAQSAYIFHFKMSAIAPPGNLD